MSNGQGAQLVDVQLFAADWYRKRLGNFFRRTLNQGLGAYLVFAISLTIALISARLAWMGGMEDRKYVSDLMKTEVQPQSEATHGVVLSLLLAGLASGPLSDELYCKGPTSHSCKTGAKLWKVTQGLVDALEKAQSRPDGEELRLTSVATQLQTDWPGSDLNSLEQRLAGNVHGRERLMKSASTIGAQTRADSGDLCGDPKDIAQRAQMFYLAAPYCVNNADEVTIQVIPQQAADAFDIAAPLIEETAAGDVRRQRDFRVLRAQLDAEVFDIAVRSMRHELIATQPEMVNSDDADDSVANDRRSPGPIITAAFFISVDSVIRYWSRSGELKPTSLPAHRLWAARPYFETMLNKIDSATPLTTRAYMDFAGHGVVYTECHPLTANWRLFPPRAEPARSITPAPVVVGAVCVDYALSDVGVTKLVAKVDSGPVADASRIVFSTGAAGKWAPEPFKQMGWTRSEALDKELKKAADDFSTNAESRRDIRSIDIKGADSTIFLVPLRVRVDGKLDAILLRVTGVGPLGSRPEAMIVAAIFGAIALGSLLAGFRSSKAVAARERLLGRLRSLQVGVVQTDGSDYITAANDRAEELFDRPMPPFGIVTRVRPKFWEVFNKTRILFDKRNLHLLSSDLRPGDLSLGSEDEIKKERELGKTTAYFVSLKTPRVNCVAPPTDATATDANATDEKQDEDRTKLSSWWVRITAGPILMPIKERPDRWLGTSTALTNDLDSTFGVVEPVSSKLGKYLDMELERLRQLTPKQEPSDD
jgi:hypothetical protein